MEHVGIVVDDLAAATEFFTELGLVLQGEGPVEGRWVDRVVGLEGVRAEIAMMQTPDRNGRLELTKFHSPFRISRFVRVTQFAGDQFPMRQRFARRIGGRQAELYPAGFPYTMCQS